MQTLTCDVLVVGLGPAGSSAARAAARSGADVLAVDRREAVGLPVQCAEYVPAQLVGQLGLGREYIVQPIRGMRTFLPDGRERLTRTPGFTIRRDLLDQTLARAAAASGARLLLATRAQTMAPDRTVILRGKDGAWSRVSAKVIVGADGPRSKVGRWVGAVNRHLLPGVQATLRLAQPLDCTEVYLDPSLYAGYGWCFPKGELANVGLGVRRDAAHPGDLRDLLDGFVARLKRAGKVKGEPVGHAAGWIPAEPVRRAVYGNVLLAGDAAGHTHPITGAGVFAAVTGGAMAGLWAARAAASGDPDVLAGYEEEWRDLLADALDRAARRRALMERRWDEFDRVIPACWVAYREYYAPAP
jgi:geranylgeranyl reductase family protein